MEVLADAAGARPALRRALGAEGCWGGHERTGRWRRGAFFGGDAGCGCAVWRGGRRRGWSGAPFSLAIILFPGDAGFLPPGAAAGSLSVCLGSFESAGGRAGEAFAVLRGNNNREAGGQ